MKPEIKVRVSLFLSTHRSKMADRASIQSSQEFVRTLKAPSDPPVGDGPTKLEIAQEAWSNEAFYVPSKGEVIAEWILTKLLKEKDKTNVCVWFSFLYSPEAFIYILLGC